MGSVKLICDLRRWISRAGISILPVGDWRKGIVRVRSPGFLTAMEKMFHSYKTKIWAEAWRRARLYSCRLGGKST